MNNRYRHCKLWVKNSRSILTIQFVRLSANCNISLFHFLFPPQIKYFHKIIQSQFPQNHLQVIQKVQTTFCNWTNLLTSRILWVCPKQIGWSDRLLCCCCRVFRCFKIPPLTAIDNIATSWSADLGKHLKQFEKEVPSKTNKRTLFVFGESFFV